jgi:formylglycine-generating enzyme required for sulfatase activity
MSRSIPPISPHPWRTRWKIALVLALVGCAPGRPNDDGAGGCQGNVGCSDAAALEASVASAAKRTATGSEESSADGSVDASLSSDLGTPSDASPEAAQPIAPPDAAPDAAVAPDVAPAVSAPDTAVDGAPDAAPDVMIPDAAVVITPDSAPDSPPDVAPDSGTGCPASGAGPAMVKVQLAAQPFCIDATEVTSAQYAAFLAATGEGSQTAGQPTACGWNTSYLPSSDGLAWPYAAGRENRPVVNVDWCDARAFCKWAGKRLCGKIGGGPLVGWSAGAAPSTSQWTNACSRGGQLQYPYGSTWNSQACNTSAPSEKAQYIADVMHFSRCEGGYQGVFDLSGNVEEWVDACDKNGGSGDLCASAARPPTWAASRRPRSPARTASTDWRETRSTSCWDSAAAPTSELKSRLLDPARIAGFIGFCGEPESANQVHGSPVDAITSLEMVSQATGSGIRERGPP